jgi:hypothetical protein
MRGDIYMSLGMDVGSNPTAASKKTIWPRRPVVGHMSLWANAENEKASDIKGGDPIKGLGDADTTPPGPQKRIYNRAPSTPGLHSYAPKTHTGFYIGAINYPNPQKTREE